LVLPYIFRIKKNSKAKKEKRTPPESEVFLIIFDKTIFRDSMMSCQDNNLNVISFYIYMTIFQIVRRYIFINFSLLNKDEIKEY